MAKKLKGGKTGRKTNVGRDVYAIIKGDKDTDLGLSNIISVSEISASIPLAKNRWMNIPSIWNGMRYTDDELKELYERGKIKATSFHKSQKEAEAAAEKRSKNLMIRKKGGGLSSLYEDELGFGQAPKTRTEAYRKLLEPYWKNNPVAKLGFELVGGAKGIVKLIESSDPKKRKLYKKTMEELTKKKSSLPPLGIANIGAPHDYYGFGQNPLLYKSLLKTIKEYGGDKLFPEAMKKIKQHLPFVLYQTKGKGGTSEAYKDIYGPKYESKNPATQRQDYNQGLMTLVHELTHIGDKYLSLIGDDGESLSENDEYSRMKGHPLIKELDYIAEERLRNTPYSSKHTKWSNFGNPFYEYEKLAKLVSKIYGEDDDKWPQKIKDMLEEEEIRGDTIRSSRKAMYNPIFRKAHYGTSTPPSSIEELQELFDKPQRKKVLNDPIFREAQYELDRLKKLYKQLGSKGFFSEEIPKENKNYRKKIDDLLGQ